MPFSSKSLLLLMMMNHTRVNLVVSWLVYVMSGGGGGDGVFIVLGFCTDYCRRRTRHDTGSLYGIL